MNDIETQTRKALRRVVLFSTLRAILLVPSKLLHAVANAWECVPDALLALEQDANRRYFLLTGVATEALVNGEWAEPVLVETGEDEE